MTQQEFFNRYIYNIRTDRIGGGGFGTVYKAHDRVLHREVAIKVSEVKVAANGKSFSLKDEFNALQHLPKHPNIANYEELYSFDMPNGFFDYAVMQYYPDGNLTNLIGSSLSLEQKEDIALQLLDGIDFLHDHKVVHRDLKPGNILIVRHSGKIIPLITDFGLSKTADAGDRSLFSNSFGGGTARYSSPEQLQGKPLRMNTDLWSYGAIVFELFTGKPLFEAGSSAINTAQADLEIYNKIIHGDTEDRLSDIPDKWRKVLECCLVVDPEKRAKSAEELRGMLSEGVDRDDTIISDKTIEAKEEEHIVEDDHTRVESPKLSENQDVQKANSASVPSSPISKTKQKKALPWIIGGGVIIIIFVTLWLNRTVIPENNYGKYTIHGATFNMIPVYGGTFDMGSNDGDFGEKPAHSVTVSDFCIGETEVTQALWKAVMGNNPSRFKGNDLPVDNVSWYDCQLFIQKLNTLTGKTFRLPTEAEWEYAARGGRDGKAYRYAGSDNVDEVAWYQKNSRNKTHRVKTMLPNTLGLYQMSGNVSEWCEDWYDSVYYDNSSKTNPKGPSSGTFRVFRGGNWLWLGGMEVYFRGFAAPGNDEDEVFCGNHGFRLASDYH